MMLQRIVIVENTYPVKQFIFGVNYLDHIFLLIPLTCVVNCGTANLQHLHFLSEDFKL
jgi:hypothetical protein